MMLKNILQNNLIISMLLFFQDLNEGTTLTAINGQERPALEIFSHALHYFKEHALQQMKDQSSTNILNEDVRWVITVPAIWKAEAKQFMRRAAYDVSEPELEILYFNSEYFILYKETCMNKQRVLMHRHQGWNVRHGLCHIYMRYLYIYELFIAFVCFVVCSLL